MFVDALLSRRYKDTHSKCVTSRIELEVVQRRDSLSCIKDLSPPQLQLQLLRRTYRQTVTGIIRNSTFTTGKMASQHSVHHHDLTSKPFTLDFGTIASLALVFSFLPISQLLAAYLLPKSISRTHYYLFLWCSFDVLTHSIVEGSYLYHCFFSYINLPSSSSDYPHPASQGRLTSHSLIQPGPFLGRGDRLYGSFYSEGPMARLWQEYAKADRRWGGADPTVISLELLTVFGAGPLAFYICTLIVSITNNSYNHNTKNSASGTGTGTGTGTGRNEAKLWFTAVVLSTAEIYGGFITFAPEWLTMNTLLDGGGDTVYLWLYLCFFNLIWVFIPFWVLYVAWREMIVMFERLDLNGSKGEQQQQKRIKKIT